MHINPTTNIDKPSFKSLKIERINSWKKTQLNCVLSNRAIKKFSNSLDLRGYDVIAKKFEFEESSFWKFQNTKHEGLTLSVKKQNDNNDIPFNFTYFCDIKSAVKNFNFNEALETFAKARLH